jgi:hypothetical protein
LILLYELEPLLVDTFLCFVSLVLRTGASGQCKSDNKQNENLKISHALLSFVIGSQRNGTLGIIVPVLHICATLDGLVKRRLAY